MKIVAVIAGVAVIAALVAITSSDDGQREAPPFHATLADPDLYVDGEFAETVRLEQGQYRLRFTPNGDSPKILSIKIIGDAFSYVRDFELDGTLHSAGISEYYTWEYLGDKRVEIPESQYVRIAVNPNGDYLGPVSVSLLRE